MENAGSKPNRPETETQANKFADYRIEKLNARFITAGIPTTIENTGGNVFCCQIRTFAGEFLISPSEVDPSGFMYGFYDASGDEIESVDELRFKAVLEIIQKNL
jgi:hypothetical protein